ncbi:MAG TPA: hypothetical protein VNT42_11390 [Sphingomonas sp.]|nr:hypothetical protein [Sphingomonas sp.]
MLCWVPIASTLHYTHSLSLLGQQTLVETVGITGYYTLVARLNAFETTASEKSEVQGSAGS